MAILGGYRKSIRWLKEMTGFRKLSQWTSASSVELSDGTAVEDKVNTLEASLSSHTTSKGNVHGMTKDDIGLSKVDNTPDREKSVSYATYSGEASKVAWSNITGRPNEYQSAAHTHDERYYTETEVDNLLSKYSKATFSLSGTTLNINN